MLYLIICYYGILIIDDIYRKFNSFYKIGIESSKLHLHLDSYFEVPIQKIKKIEYDGLFDNIIIKSNHDYKIKLNKLNFNKDFLLNIIEFANNNNIDLSENFELLEIKPINLNT